MFDDISGSFTGDGFSVWNDLHGACCPRLDTFAGFVDEHFAKQLQRTHKKSSEGYVYEVLSCSSASYPSLRCQGVNLCPSILAISFFSGIEIHYKRL